MCVCVYVCVLNAIIWIKNIETSALVGIELICISLELKRHLQIIAIVHKI